MKILAPVTSAQEAVSLISHGAGELYCGLRPASWGKRYGQRVRLNRRGQGNIEDFSQLKSLTDTAHARDVPVYLALNLPFYPPEQYGEILELAGESYFNCQVDALIISDPGLLQAIGNTYPQIPIHVSSLAAVLNSGAVSFFRDLGAKRIIFPRYLGLADLQQIINKSGRHLEYEVFILNDGCVFEEGYCHVNHALGGGYCLQPGRRYRLLPLEQGKLPRENFNRHLQDYQRWLWIMDNCGGYLNHRGFPNGMCGLCALPELKAMGVNSLKIVGREAPLAKKIASVKLVKRVMDLLASGEDPELIRQRAKQIRGTPDLCTGYMCYYRS